MKFYKIFNYKLILIIFSLCFYSLGCTTLKYTAPIVIKDGIATGGEKFELRKHFVLTKVTGFKVIRGSDGSVNASFDTVENADSKAIEALSDFAKTAMSMAVKTP